MDNINKQELEKILGYEIENFKIEPVFDGEKLIKFNILIQPKTKIEFLDLNFKILYTNE